MRIFSGVFICVAIFLFGNFADAYYFADTEGIAISANSYSQYAPSIAFDGTNYLVVWYENREGDEDIYGCVIDKSGVVVGQQEIVIAKLTGSQSYPRVVFDGTNYFVVWHDTRSGANDIYGCRINTSGTVLDPSGIPICTAVSIQSYPDVCYYNPNYFVVWHDIRGGNNDIYGSRVSASGTALDTIVICNAVFNQEYPSVTCDGTNFFVAWTDNRSGGNTNIFGALVNTSGILTDSFPVCTGTSDMSNPSVAYDGTNYLVVWYDYRVINADIYATRVTKSGIVIDSGGFVVCNATSNQMFPSIAFDGKNYFAVWYDYRNANGDVYGCRITKSATVLDANGVAVSNAATNQERPKTVFNGDNYFIVWSDNRNLNGDIYGARYRARPLIYSNADTLLIVNTYYSFLLTDTAGEKPETWTVITGNLADGMTLNGSTGELSGTPAASGTFSFIVKVTDSFGLEDTKSFSVAIVNTYKISGIVRNRDGAAVSGVKVVISGDSSAEYTTADDGYYRFERLVSGKYNTSCSKDNYSFSPPERNYEGLSEDKMDQDFTAVLAGGKYKISGRIKDEKNEPLQGTDVILSGKENGKYATGADGRYVFENLLSGNYKVRPVKFGYDFSPSEKTYAELYSDEEQDFTARMKYTESRTRIRNNLINPTKGEKTTVEYKIEKDSAVEIIIYNVNGNLVRYEKTEAKSPGTYSFEWDGRDDNGTVAGSGVYSIKIKTSYYREDQRAVVLK